MRKKRLQTVLAATAATACIIGGVAVAWKCLPAVTVENQEKVTVEQENKGITVHYFWALNDEPRVYYTEVDGNKVAMEEQGVPMKSEGNNWYSYTIPNAEKVTLKFKVDQYEYVTANETYSSGEYWIEENTSHDTMTDAYKNTVYAQNTKDTEMETENVASQNVVSKNQLATKGFQKIVRYKQTSATSAKDITLHYPSDWASIQIYGWNGLPSDVDMVWPGDALTKDDKGYYTYTFSDVNKVNFLFHNGTEQSEEFTVKGVGEYWYSNGKWVTEDPNTGGTATDRPIQSSTPSTPRPATKGEKLGGDFREDTIYFLMTTRFYDGDSGNNVYCWDGPKGNKTNNDPEWRGDFKGLIEKLDYIKALGFSAIWITPVVENASGYDYHGYHASDFSKVDERYESDGVTYQTLIDACHKKGIKVIQDIVLNHTGNWGEANLYHMFNKGEVTTDADGNKMSAPMEVGGDKVDQLNAGATKKGAADYADAITKKKEYDARIAAMKEDDIDTDGIYHHYPNLNWDDKTCQLGQIAGDCVDLNTENPIVYNYLIDCYNNYIGMGVDGFRVDTVKHISRLTFNKSFLPAFKKSGGEDFYMFGEVCARFGGVWYRDTPPLSCPFYTWKESNDVAWSDTDWEANYNAAIAHYDANLSVASQPTSDNAFLNGNDYHETDYSLRSGLDQIDFPMHWNFSDANSAFGFARSGDQYYNDATWNVVYVDSHDYGPDFCQDYRYQGGEEAWAENLCLMFTFRGIPCIYYGSEVEFKKEEMIDKGPTILLENSGRAYYGSYLEGEVTASDYGTYKASGTVAETLNSPLSQQIIRLNQIRRAVPALQKGQYSCEGVAGTGIGYKRRYTDSSVDSYALVNISGSSTFTGVENGTYIEVVTGKEVTVSNGTLTTESVGKGNLRVYVLKTAGCTVSGKIGSDGKYIK